MTIAQTAPLPIVLMTPNIKTTKNRLKVTSRGPRESNISRGFGEVITPQRSQAR
jgi:hypothetical protein